MRAAQEVGPAFDILKLSLEHFRRRLFGGVSFIVNSLSLSLSLSLSPEYRF